MIVDYWYIIECIKVAVEAVCKWGFFLDDENKIKKCFLLLGILPRLHTIHIRSIIQINGKTDSFIVVK